jgi:hypothetical protein
MERAPDEAAQGCLSQYRLDHDADAFEKAIATTVNKAAKDTENTIPQSKKDAA